MYGIVLFLPYSVVRFYPYFIGMHEYGARTSTDGDARCRQTELRIYISIDLHAD